MGNTETNPEASGEGSRSDVADELAQSGNNATADDAPANASHPPAQDLTLLLEAARAKADEHWNQLLRAQAELDNLRKRTARDLGNAHKFALERFVEQLLPVMDGMELGLSAAANGTIDVESLKEGMELTLRMLATVMEKFGIQQINPRGEKFDPQRHEAMTMQPSTDVEPGAVLTVIQKGYLLNDRLIRPAKVVVVRAEETTQEPSMQDDQEA